MITSSANLRYGEYSEEEQIQLMNLDARNFRIISNPTEKTYLTTIHSMARSSNNMIVHYIGMNDKISENVEMALLELYYSDYICLNKTIKNTQIIEKFLNVDFNYYLECVPYIAFSLFINDARYFNYRDDIIKLLIMLDGEKYIKKPLVIFFDLMNQYREEFTYKHWFMLVKHNSDYGKFIPINLLTPDAQIDLMKINTKVAVFIPEEKQIDIVKKYCDIGATCDFEYFLKIEGFDVI